MTNANLDANECAVRSTDSPQVAPYHCHAGPAPRRTDETETAAAVRRILLVGLAALLPGAAAAANGRAAADVVRSIHRMQTGCEPQRMTFACVGWSHTERAPWLAGADGKPRRQRAGIDHQGQPLQVRHAREGAETPTARQAMPVATTPHDRD